MFTVDINIIQKNTNAILVSSKVFRLEVNTEETKCMFMFRLQETISL